MTDQRLPPPDQPTLAAAELEAKYPGYWEGPAGARVAYWRHRALQAEARLAEMFTQHHTKEQT